MLFTAQQFCVALLPHRSVPCFMQAGGSGVSLRRPCRAHTWWLAAYAVLGILLWFASISGYELGCAVAVIARDIWQTIGGGDATPLQV
jgi:hypothetical protein